MCNASCGYCCGGISVFAIIFMSILGLMFSTGYEYVGEFDEAVTGGDVHAFYKQSAKNCFMVVLAYVGVLFLSVGCCFVGNCRQRRYGDLVRTLSFPGRSASARAAGEGHGGARRAVAGSLTPCARARPVCACAPATRRAHGPSRMK